MKKILGLIIISIISISYTYAGNGEDIIRSDVKINNDLLQCEKYETNKKYYLSSESISFGKHFYLINNKKEVVKDGNIIYRGNEILIDDFQYSSDKNDVAFTDSMYKDKVFSIKLIKNGKIIDTSNNTDFQNFILTEDGEDVFYSKYNKEERQSYFYKNGELLEKGKICKGSKNGDYFCYKFNTPDVFAIMEGNLSDSDNKTSFYINGKLIGNYAGKKYGFIKFIDETNYSFILKKDNGNYTVIINGNDLGYDFKEIGIIKGKNINGEEIESKDLFYHGDKRIYIGNKKISADLNFDTSTNFSTFNFGGGKGNLIIEGDNYFLVGGGLDGFFLIKNGKIIFKDKKEIKVNFLDKENYIYKVYNNDRENYNLYKNGEKIAENIHSGIGNDSNNELRISADNNSFLYISEGDLYENGKQITNNLSISFNSYFLYLYDNGNEVIYYMYEDNGEYYYVIGDKQYKGWFPIKTPFDVKMVNFDSHDIESNNSIPDFEFIQEKYGKNNNDRQYIIDKGGKILYDNRLNQIYKSNNFINISGYKDNNILIGDDIGGVVYSCIYSYDSKFVEVKENIIEKKSNPRIDRLLSKIFYKIDKKGKDKAKLVYQGLIKRIDTLIIKAKTDKNKELLNYIKEKVLEKMK